MTDRLDHALSRAASFFFFFFFFLVLFHLLLFFFVFGECVMRYVANDAPRNPFAFFLPVG